MPIRRIFLLSCFLLLFSLAGVSLAAEKVVAQKTPHEVIGGLWKYMWCGRGMDCSGGRLSLSIFVEEEKKAAAAISELIRSGQSTTLIERVGLGVTPLMSAASHGYSEIVGELLKSSIVRSEIDAINSEGISAWIYANMAKNQTDWSCNYSLEPDWIRLHRLQRVRRYQSYYVLSAENPYTKTRRLLEEAGAKTNLEQAKQYWLSTCKEQNEKARAKVQGSKDLLATLLAESTDELKNFWAERQQGMAICPVEIDNSRARQVWAKTPKTPKAFLQVIKTFMEDPQMDGFDFGEKIFGFAREDWGEPRVGTSSKGSATITYQPLLRWQGNNVSKYMGHPPLPTPYRNSNGEYGIDGIILNENDELLGTDIVVFEEPFCLSPIHTKDIFGEPENVSGFDHQDYLTLSYKIVRGEDIYSIQFSYAGNAKEGSRMSHANKSEFSKIIGDRKDFCAEKISISRSSDNVCVAAGTWLSRDAFCGLSIHREERHNWIIE